MALRLVRLLCPDCKQPAELTEAECNQIYGKSKAIAHTVYFRSVGCERCYFTGYKGRKAIYEVIPIDEELADAVRENRPDVSVQLKERGVTTLRDAALELFHAGQTSLEELLPLLRE